MIKGEQLKVIIIDEGKPIHKFKGTKQEVRQNIFSFLRGKY
jgi:hypothetical protein